MRLKKPYLIMLVLLVLVIGVFGARAVFGGKSPEEIKKENIAKVFALKAWRIKHDARLETNKEKLLDFKQNLINYYSAESGALVEQQRLIDALTAADEAAAKDDNSGERIFKFDITDVKIFEEKYTDDKADIKGEIEYFIRYYTEAQNYSTYGKNTYRWQLQKEKGKWRVTKEEMLPTEE